MTLGGTARRSGTGARTDQRGQSVVIGSILIFSILIGMLGILQVYVVPQQNAEVELTHQSEVKHDFTDLHAGILNAVDTGRPYTGTFQLGARYPSRFVLLNPPDPQGTLRTEAVGPLDDTVTDTTGDSWHVGRDVCGLDAGTETRSLVYEPRYHEIDDTGFYAYENSITHHSIGTGASQRFIDPQTSVVEDRTVHLRPLVGEEFARSTPGSETVRFRTNETGRITVAAGETLRLPTRMTADQWRETVDGTALTVSGAGPNEVELTAQADLILVCTPVGMVGRPNTDPAPDAVVGGPNDENFINPVGEGTLEYRETVADGSEFDIRFFSHNAPHDVVGVRVAAVNHPGQNGETIAMAKETEEVMTVGGRFERPATTWSWTTDEMAAVAVLATHSETTVTLNPNTEITLQFELSSGRVLTYVVEFPSGGGGPPSP